MENFLSVEVLVLNIQSNIAPIILIDLNGRNTVIDRYSLEMVQTSRKKLDEMSWAEGQEISGMQNI